MKTLTKNLLIILVCISLTFIIYLLTGGIYAIFPIYILQDLPCKHKRSFPHRSKP